MSRRTVRHPSLLRLLTSHGELALLGFKHLGTMLSRCFLHLHITLMSLLTELLWCHFDHLVGWVCIGLRFSLGGGAGSCDGMLAL